MKTVSQVMTELKKKGTEQYRRTFLRHGAPSNLFGVSVADGSQMTKKQLDPAEINGLLARIVKEIHTAPNEVRSNMNRFVIAVCSTQVSRRMWRCHGDPRSLLPHFTT